MTILRAAIPPDTLAWYEGRWIIDQTGTVDIVPDRHGMEGKGLAKAQLATWLNPALRQTRSNVCESLRNGDLSTRDTSWYILYEADGGTVLGNPNNSGGYLYVVAYMFKHMDQGLGTKGYEFNVFPWLREDGSNDPLDATAET